MAFANSLIHNSNCSSLHLIEHPILGVCSVEPLPVLDIKNIALKKDRFDLDCWKIHTPIIKSSTVFANSGSNYIQKNQVHTDPYFLAISC